MLRSLYKSSQIIQRCLSTMQPRKIQCVVQTNFITASKDPDTYYNILRHKDHPPTCFTSIPLQNSLNSTNIISKHDDIDWRTGQFYEYHTLNYNRQGTYLVLMVSDNENRVPLCLKIKNIKSDTITTFNGNIKNPLEIKNDYQVAEIAYEISEIKKGEHKQITYYSYTCEDNPLIFLCAPINQTNYGIDLKYEYNGFNPYDHKEGSGRTHSISVYFNRVGIYYLVEIDNYSTRHKLYNCGDNSNKIKIVKIGVF